MITVNHTGELGLYEFTNGVCKTISHAKLAVDELLSAPLSLTPASKGSDTPAPDFISLNPSPLYYPTCRMKIMPGKVFVLDNIGIVAVNETQRVFFVNEIGKSASEVLNYIEKGDLFVGAGSDDKINILVSNTERGSLKLYKIDTTTLLARSTDLSFDMPDFSSAVYEEDFFHIVTRHKSYDYNCITGTFAERKFDQSLPGGFRSALRRHITPEGLMAAIVKTRYHFENESIFFRITTMYLNSNKQLVVGKHYLSVFDQVHIGFREQKKENRSLPGAKPRGESLSFVQNKDVRFNVWVWDDGSEAIVDSRGMLHLRSANPDIPEITIVMVLNRATACWASDGTAAGNRYFINEKISTVISVSHFNEAYIQKYIDQLL
jgi:hypothetical protein